MSFASIINWSSILTSAIALVAAIILRLLLDFNLANFIVKYFYWLRLRTLFRYNPVRINGVWGQIWSIEGSDSFESEDDRYSKITIRQLGKYCYGVLVSKEQKYVVYGKVKENYFLGEWYDKNDRIGYFGTFELRISDSKNMEGIWLGHSKSSYQIRAHRWTWKKGQ